MPSAVVLTILREMPLKSREPSVRGGEFMSSVANLDAAAMALLPQWVVPPEGGAPYAVVNSPPKSSLAARECAAVGWMGESSKNLKLLFLI